MRFTDIFVRRPVLATVTSLLILLIGLKSFLTLPIRQYPDLQNTVITVTTQYPGASAELMQGFITVPIAQAVAGAEGVEYLKSTSSQNVSTIQAYVRLNFDPSKAMTDVMAKVQQVKYQIPKEANDPVITKTTGDTTAVMYIGFSSKEMQGSAITDYLSRVVQPLIATVPGVASAEILGGQPFAMRVWLDPTRMAARGVSPEDVAAALRANNYQSAAGQAKGYFTLTNVSADTDLQNLDDFRAMVVKAEGGGALVRLRDVATVELGAKSSDSAVALNGLNAVFIGVNATPDGNPLDIVRGVRGLVPSIERGLPPTLDMRIAYDSTEFINASISEVERTLAEAIGIVIVVIFLFLGSFRSVLIPVVTIPLSIVGAGTLMLAMGFSLNLLTLLAMVLAIGLVVDDAIVVVENVYRHIEEGKTPTQAALVGAREIAGPVITMTITLAAVYAPIGFLGGLTGSLFREFALTLAGAVIISGVVALTLSPMMCSKLLSAESQHGRFARLVDRTFGAITRWYGRRLEGTLAYRPITALFAVAVLSSLAFLFANTSAELAPEEDQGVMFGLSKGPQNANIDYMNAFGKQVDGIFASFPETDLRFVVAGMNGQTNSGFVGMVLKPWDQRERSLKAIQQPLQEKLDQVTGVQAFAFSKPPLPGGGDGLPVQMVISSPAGFEAVYQAMDRIKAAARKSGMFIVTDSDLAFDNPVIKVAIDRAKASDLGITMAEVGDALATLLGGNYTNYFNLEGRSYQVIPQLPRETRLSLDKIGTYYVKTRSGDSIPLSTIVKVTTATEPNALTQYNQMNSATFSAVPMPTVSMGQAVDFLKAKADELLPADFRYDFLSQSRQYVKEGNQLTYTFAFALVIIFLVLAAQFESLRDPLVIMVSVPMSICGALIPLFFGVATLNIYTQIGLVTLIGLITKHGILMVEFANELQRDGNLDRRAAIEEAAKVRLRPILMTTAAMVVGLVPLLVATGAGAASRFSIGLVIVAGMSIGTLFTLFVLPTVYTYIASDHRPARSARRDAEIRRVAEEPA